MCGRLNVIDDPYVVSLCEELGVPISPNSSPDEPPYYNKLLCERFIRATNNISIIVEREQKRQLLTAIWWLLLEPSDNGFKPSKYTSFNTRYDKLNTPRSAGYKAFRESRCIIPAKGFGETEGKGANAIYTDFEAVNGAIAFGGLYREWLNKKTGESVFSCSIITLPPHEKIKPFHSKASPLMLSQSSGTMEMWLDPTIHDTELFNDLLTPSIHQDLSAHQIDKPSLHNPVKEPVFIKSDDC